MIWKHTLAWIPMVPIAIVNGAARQFFVYGPQMSELAAHQISCFTGIALFLLYGWFLGKRLPLSKMSEAWIIGALWLVLTILFEFMFGRFAGGRSWSLLLQDYNVFEGRLWSLVLAALFCIPAAVFRFRRNKPATR